MDDPSCSTGLLPQPFLYVVFGSLSILKPSRGELPPGGSGQASPASPCALCRDLVGGTAASTPVRL